MYEKGTKKETNRLSQKIINKMTTFMVEDILLLEHL